MTVHIARFQERATRYDIPEGTHGVFDFDAHAVPLEWHDGKAGFDIGEHFFAKASADLVYSNDAWEIVSFYIDGTDVTQVPGLAWLVDSCQRYIATVPNMVEHDHEV